MIPQYKYFYRRPADHSPFPDMSDWGTHSLTDSVKNIRSICSVSANQIKQIKDLKPGESAEFILPLRGTRDTEKVVVFRQC